MFHQDANQSESSDEPPSSPPDPLSSQGSHSPSSAKSLPYQSSWPVILFVVGLDYLSTLAYQPSIAFGVAGRLAPFASLVVAFVTLFLTLPLYWYIAGRSPEGGGSTALLERLIPGWFGKFLILVLLGFGAVDLVLTRTFSVTNAAEHILHSPTAEWQSLLDRSSVAGESAHRALPESLRGWTEAIRHRQTAVTLLVLMISTAAGLLFFKGYNRQFVRVSFAVAIVYLALTLVVVGSGAFYLSQHGDLLENWWRAVSSEEGVGHREATPAWTTLFGRCLPLFPFLALGLSGFELTLMAMPYIKGQANEHPQDRRGRIRNTRKLLVSAALLMCLYLLGSTLISTVLIPAEAITTHGQARDRTIAYLTHGGLLSDGHPASEMNGLFGPIFGTIYDVSTVLILALAGLSVALTLAAWIPPYLCRLGMEFNWSVRLGLLAYLFIAVKIAVVVFFGADIEAQRYAYLTAVLAVFAFAALAALIDVYAKRKQKGWKRWVRFSPSLWWPSPSSR